TASGNGSRYTPMATIWAMVLALPPRLAGMTPYRMTQNRSRVTPISLAAMVSVTHHGSSPSRLKPTSADPVSALSAIGSAILPKSVIRPYLRATHPSTWSVSEATANSTAAASRHPRWYSPSGSLPRNSATRNTGTITRRETVSRLATFSSGTRAGFACGCSWGVAAVADPAVSLRSGRSARGASPALLTRRSRPLGWWLRSDHPDPQVDPLGLEDLAEHQRSRPDVGELRPAVQQALPV